MDLDIVRVIKSIPKKPEHEELQPLMTPWGEELAANEDATPLARHPRPQFARRRVKLLNGWWEYAIVAREDAAAHWADATSPEAMDGRIRVPFSPEAPLSGVGRQLQPQELLWYRTELAVPAIGDEDRYLLHFDGVDHACAVYLDGKPVGTHEGAYQPFAFDVTDEVRGGSALLELCVYDPSEMGTQLRGKQRLKRGGMWYTAQSGIWQTVWLEAVPATRIDDLRFVCDPDRGQVIVTAWLEGTARLAIDVVDDQGTVVASGGAEPVEGVGIVGFEIEVPSPHLWTPDDPYLYRLHVSYGNDQVRSYCAFRTVTMERDEQGVMRLCLNHKPFFVRGLLDQGYWPDGLMTAPSEEAMVADLQAVRDLGFNAVRKHIKVEPERWYWHCDRLGILVWQDMPSGGAVPSDRYSRDLPTLFKDTWHVFHDSDAKGRERLGAGDEAYRAQWTDTMATTVSRLSNHPCIAAWVLFNESWGQFDAGLATQMSWEIDPTRPVISVSGWYDQGTGDVFAVHNYFRKMHLFKDPFMGRKRGPRAQVLSEFGGLTWRVDGHSSLAHSYGYAQFETKDAWRASLAELIGSVDALEEQGLSGFIYTQLSDVEEETNGLLTYDRRVNKFEGGLELPSPEPTEGEPVAEVAGHEGATSDALGQEGAAFEVPGQEGAVSDAPGHEGAASDAPEPEAPEPTAEDPQEAAPAGDD